MITIREMSPAEAAEAMRAGEFGASVREASPNVAVVLTQDWCGQWAALERSLRELAEPAGSALGGTPEVTVFLLIYNLEPYFTEFMRFKEEVLGNDAIPYVRYYRNGRLVGQSNYVSGLQFLTYFQG